MVPAGNDLADMIRRPHPAALQAKPALEEIE
jgi:hypothetical protein